MSLAVLLARVLIKKPGSWPPKKKNPSLLVSHDYWCFLWLYLCTLTVSPFTETVTGGVICLHEGGPHTHSHAGGKTSMEGLANNARRTCHQMLSRISQSTFRPMSERVFLKQVGPLRSTFHEAGLIHRREIDLIGVTSSKRQLKCYKTR